MSMQQAPEREIETAVGDVMIEVRGLKKYYESGGPLSGSAVKAVDGVDFEIKRGETLGLVGESGCGKTTLGRTLLGLESATDGEVLFEGQDVTTLSGEDLKEWQRNAQMVFQDPESSLNDRMTVGEIIREPLDVHDWKDPEDRRARVRELLDVVGLAEEHYYRYPHQFSGGQRQRIGIARSLALNPEFIVLDEPVSALDVSVQAQVLNLLEDLQDEFGLTYLVIAHDLSVVRHIADRVAVMYLGHVMELGDTEDLFTDAANPYTISLLSAIPQPDPTHEQHQITLRGTPPSPRDPPEGCPFSTRCPMKIRPDKYDDIDDEVWEAVETFREVVRERTRTDRSLREIVRDYLGMETRFSHIDEIVRETFDGLDVPQEVEAHIDTAADMVDENDPEGARDYLLEEFGSTCDTDRPEFQSLANADHQSKCARHGSTTEQEPWELVDRSIFIE